MDVDQGNENEEEDKRSSHSSWIIDQTYSFHHMLIGGEMKEKYLKIFDDEEHLYKVKDAEYAGNGVKIDQIVVRDLHYLGKDNIAKSSLYRIIGRLKQWV